MKTVPMIITPGIVLLPGMLTQIDLSDKTKKAAATEAFDSDGQLFVLYKNEIECPMVGVLVKVVQLITATKEEDYMVVQVERRAFLHDVVANKPIMMGDIELINEKESDEDDDLNIRREALMRYIKELAVLYFAENSMEHPGKLNEIREEKDFELLVDIVAAATLFQSNQLIDVLTCLDTEKRYALVATMLTFDLSILKTKKEISQKVKSAVDKNQREYVMREQIRVLKEELGETPQKKSEEYREQLKKLVASEEIKTTILHEIERYENISLNSSESEVSHNYIKTLLAIPWEEMSDDNLQLDKANSILQKEHYGLEKVKERILEYIAVRFRTCRAQSQIICLVGPPGTGKTSIVKSVARALNKEYIRICLGGMRDEAEIRGHRRTYIGALPGQLIRGLMKAKVKNPVILLDEIDKVSHDVKGDPASALLEVLDPEQNKYFTDHYVELPVDLSQVVFMCTANEIDTIPRPLLDRMEIIEVSSYTESDKFHIAKKFLYPKQLKKSGLTKNELSINDTAMRKIIGTYTREAGVRQLEREIAKICRKTAKEIMLHESIKVRISAKNLQEYLGKPKFKKERIQAADEIGIVCGLAWTQVGGELLEIEVNVMPGEGGIELTGQLGDVMKESAKIAMSYVRSLESIHHKDGEFFATHDFHLHVPEGSVPKDGPSAGITMAVAILSAVMEKPVRHDVAMTGELTLRGRVLPVGGLKEKLLAARQAGIMLCFVPEDNRLDIEELPIEIHEGMEIRYITQVKDSIQDFFV